MIKLFIIYSFHKLMIILPKDFLTSKKLLKNNKNKYIEIYRDISLLYF